VNHLLKIPFLQGGVSSVNCGVIADHPHVGKMKVYQYAT